jgi:AraC-like DNA-binding protein
MHNLPYNPVVREVISMIFPDNLFTERQFMINPDFELYHYKNLELRVDLHHHDFNEIYIFLSGNVEYFIEDVKYKLHPGDILLINSQELHRPEIMPGVPYERLVLFIRPEFIMSHSRDGANLSHCFESHLNGYTHLLHPDRKMLGTIKEVLIKIFMLLNSQAFGADILKELYIFEFLVHINQCFLQTMKQKESTRVSNTLIEKTIGFINDNIENDLSLDVIASELYISKYYLSHYFKKYTGVSLHRFINYKRLMMARSLLRTGANVTYACQKSGFSDYNNFIRSFKKQYGQSPKKFSKSSVHSNSIIE